MKKILALIFIAAVMVSASGCNKSIAFGTSEKSEKTSQNSYSEASSSSELAIDTSSAGSPLEETDYIVYSGEEYTIKADSSKWKTTTTGGMEVSYNYLGGNGVTTISTGVQVIPIGGESLTLNQAVEQTIDSLKSVDGYNFKSSEKIKINGNDAYHLITEYQATDDMMVILDQRIQIHNDKLYVFQSAYDTEISDSEKADLEEVLASFTFTD